MAAAGRHAPLAAMLLLAACDSATEPDPGPDPPADEELALELVAEGLSAPLLVTAPPDDPRLFIVEQPGRIRIVRDGGLLSTAYLDISARVGSGGERGLLGLAFDPSFAESGRLWVMYTDLDGTSIVEEYRDLPGEDRADPASGQVYLALEQPFANHNGGHLVFGPDGFLYIGLGDGGSGGDPEGNGQDLSTLLGSILRVDPRQNPSPPWSVPVDNPFVGVPGARPEIAYYGLRNPWRFSFDDVRHHLWIADVGQNAWEEVDVVSTSERGNNFGWNVMEGPDCYAAATCDDEGLTAPLFAYGHDEGCSITGGHVYSGSALPSLLGWYVYSDFCAGWMRALRLDAEGAVGEPVDLGVDPGGRVTSFGVDAARELYVTVQEGRVYRIVAGG